MTVYEAAALGVPTIVIARTLKDARCASLLEEKGICRSLGFWEDVSTEMIRTSVNTLIDDVELRKTMGLQAKTMINAQGVHRVAEVIMAEVHESTS